MEWDEEFDVVCVGSGLGGLSAALTAAERGAQALADVIGIEMMVVRGLPDYYYPVVGGSAPEGRYVEVRPFDSRRLGTLADKCLTSPYGDGYSYVTSNEMMAMQSGGEHVGMCLKRHLE